MSENKDDRPRHTLSGDGEPSIPVPAQMFTKFFITDQGEPALLLVIPLPDGQAVHFTCKNEMLDILYRKFKDFMEGTGKRPAYLG